LTAEQIEGVRRRFDEIVDENAPVRVYYEDRAKIGVSSDPGRSASYRRSRVAWTA